MVTFSSTNYVEAVIVEAGVIAYVLASGEDSHGPGNDRVDTYQLSQAVALYSASGAGAHIDQECSYRIQRRWGFGDEDFEVEGSVPYLAWDFLGGVVVIYLARPL